MQHYFNYIHVKTFCRNFPFSFITILYLLFFTIDGIVTIFDLSGHGLISDSSSTFYGITFLLFFIAIQIGILFFPRFPKRILGIPLLYTYVNFIIISLLSDFSEGKFNLKYTDPFIILSGVQILLGLGLLCWLSLTQRQELGYFQMIERRPLFAWKHSIRVGICYTLGGIGFSVLSGIFLIKTLSQTLEEKSGNYVRFEKSGVFFEERIFRHDEKEIRLIAMIHIADDSFYKKISESFPKNTIVLLEGVSDKNHLLKPLSYGNIANILGLTSQSESTFSKNIINQTQEDKNRIQYRRADIDVSQMSPETVQYLNKIFEYFNQDSAYKIAEKVIMEVLSQQKNNQHNSFKSINVSKDIVDMRNVHLIQEIEKALQERSRVIVPWGAMHLPDIQKTIEQWGFMEVEKQKHLAFSLFLNLIPF